MQDADNVAALEAFAMPADGTEQVNVPTDASSGEGETTFAELAAKKGFKSADDLARSYSELERHTKEVEMTKSRSVVTDELINARETTSVPNRAVTEVPNDVNSIIDAKIRPVQARMEVSDLANRYPDLPKYAKDMASFIKSNPNASYETAYRHVKFDDLEREARAARSVETAQVHEAKAAAQSVRPNAKTSVSQSIDPSKLSAKDLEKLLPKR